MIYSSYITQIGIKISISNYNFNTNYDSKSTICFWFEYDIDMFNNNFEKFSDINLFVHSFCDLIANLKFAGNVI